MRSARLAPGLRLCTRWHAELLLLVNTEWVWLLRCLCPRAAQVSSAMKHLYNFPAAPQGPNRDGVLRWLEAFADRLWDGTFQVRRRQQRMHA